MVTDFRQLNSLSRNELAKSVFEKCYVQGEFKLRSGQTSHQYFDKYQFESAPHTLFSVCFHLAKLIPPQTDLLGGLEMGGIPIATGLSFLTGIPVVFVRKEPKTYGTCRFAEGPPISGKNICIVEDVITTGGQVLLSTNDLRSENAVIENILCVIDRSEGKAEGLNSAGLSLHALFRMNELLVHKG